MSGKGKVLAGHVGILWTLEDEREAVTSLSPAPSPRTHTLLEFRRKPCAGRRVYFHPAGGTWGTPLGRRSLVLGRGRQRGADLACGVLTGWLRGAAPACGGPPRRLRCGMPVPELGGASTAVSRSCQVLGLKSHPLLRAECSTPGAGELVSTAQRGLTSGSGLGTAQAS